MKIGILLSLGFLLKGIVAYSLWFEKDWAINLAMVDAVAGILLCIIEMFGIPFLMDRPGQFVFRGEILLLIPYLIKLIMLRRKW